MDAFESGWFTDGVGREWFCCQRGLRVGDDCISCETRDGWFTAANLKTFKLWGWTRSERAPAQDSVGNSQLTRDA